MDNPQHQLTHFMAVGAEKRLENYFFLRNVHETVVSQEIQLNRILRMLDQEELDIFYRYDTLPIGYSRYRNLYEFDRFSYIYRLPGSDAYKRLKAMEQNEDNLHSIVHHGILPQRGSVSRVQELRDKRDQLQQTPIKQHVRSYGDDLIRKEEKSSFERRRELIDSASSIDENSHSTISKSVRHTTQERIDSLSQTRSRYSAEQQLRPYDDDLIGKEEKSSFKRRRELIDSASSIDENSHSTISKSVRHTTQEEIDSLPQIKSRYSAEQQLRSHDDDLIGKDEKSSFERRRELIDSTSNIDENSHSTIPTSVRHTTQEENDSLPKTRSKSSAEIPTEIKSKHDVKFAESVKGISPMTEETLESFQYNEDQMNGSNVSEMIHVPNESGISRKQKEDKRHETEPSENWNITTVDDSDFEQETKPDGNRISNIHEKSTSENMNSNTESDAGSAYRKVSLRKSIDDTEKLPHGENVKFTSDPVKGVSCDGNRTEVDVDDGEEESLLQKSASQSEEDHEDQLSDNVQNNEKLNTLKHEVFNSKQESASIHDETSDSDTQGITDTEKDLDNKSKAAHLASTTKDKPSSAQNGTLQSHSSSEISHDLKNSNSVPSTPDISQDSFQKPEKSAKKDESSAKARSQFGADAENKKSDKKDESSAKTTSQFGADAENKKSDKKDESSAKARSRFGADVENEKSDKKDESSAKTTSRFGADVENEKSDKNDESSAKTRSRFGTDAENEKSLIEEVANLPSRESCFADTEKIISQEVQCIADDTNEELSDKDEVQNRLRDNHESDEEIENIKDKKHVRINAPTVHCNNVPGKKNVLTTLEWDALPSVRNCMIECENKNGEWTTIGEKIKSNQTKTSVEMPSWTDPLRFRLVANMTDGQILYSDPTDKISPSKGETLPVYIKPNVKVLSRESVELIWEPPSHDMSEVLMYDVEKKEQQKDIWEKVDTVDASLGAIKVDDLMNARRCEFRLKPSESLSVENQEDEIDQDSELFVVPNVNEWLSFLHVEPLSSNKIEVNIEKEGFRQCDGYSVEYSPASNDEWEKVEDISSDAPHIIIENLNESTNYKFRFTPILINDDSSRMSLILERQMPSNETVSKHNPPTFNVVQIDQNSVVIEAIPCDDDGKIRDEFDIYAKSDQEKQWHKVGKIDKTHLTANVDNLEENTAYSFKINNTSNDNSNVDPTTIVQLKLEKKSEEKKLPFDSSLLLKKFEETLESIVGGVMKAAAGHQTIEEPVNASLNEALKDVFNDENFINREQNGFETLELNNELQLFRGPKQLMLKELERDETSDVSKKYGEIIVHNHRRRRSTVDIREDNGNTKIQNIDGDIIIRNVESDILLSNGETRSHLSMNIVGQAFIKGVQGALVAKNFKGIIVIKNITNE